MRESITSCYTRTGRGVSGTGVTNRGGGRPGARWKESPGAPGEPASPSRRFGRGPRAVRYVSRPPAPRRRPASELAAAGRGAARTRPRRGAELRAPPGPPLQSWRVGRSASFPDTRAGLIPARSSRTRAGPRRVLGSARETHRPTRGRRASQSEGGLVRDSTLCTGYNIKSRPDPLSLDDPVREESALDWIRAGGRGVPRAAFEHARGRCGSRARRRPPWDIPPARDSCGTGEVDWWSLPSVARSRPSVSRSPGRQGDARAGRPKKTGRARRSAPLETTFVGLGYFFFFLGFRSRDDGSGAARRGPIPSFSRILFSISRATSALSRSKAFVFSRPWPSRRSP